MAASTGTELLVDGDPGQSRVNKRSRLRHMGEGAREEEEAGR